MAKFLKLQQAVKAESEKLIGMGSGWREDLSTTQKGTGLHHSHA
jgi:hypothetical protein